jgi:amino acid adenylation domain-containing protein
MKLSDFLLNKTDETEALARWNQTDKALDFSKSIIDLFNDQAGATPDAVACSDPRYHLHYKELEMKANQVANYLISQGVGPDQRVALYFNRSQEMLIAMLGVLKAGGCYVPLDPQYPQTYVEQILDDARPIQILASAMISGNLQVRCSCVHLDDERITSQKDVSPGRMIHPDQLAYVMYTSGSTGKPKGVMVPHRQMLNWLYALWQRAPFEDKEVVAQKTSISFAISVKELFAGLLAGVHQVFIDESIVKDIPAFVMELEHWGVTRLYTFPSQLDAILSYIESTDHTLESLSYLFISIEPCPVELLDRLNKLMPWSRAWYIYGCTEMNDMTYCDPGDQASASGFVPIGKPVLNTRIFVLNEDLRVQPIGIMGEIYVESVGISRGYWDKPGMTADRFIPNLYGEPGTRLYKTGDMARYLEDGSLEFLGRRDYEIKIRGYRVDVRQTEKVINMHPDIKESAVIGWPINSTTPQLVAYVAGQPGLTLNIESLRHDLTGKLPTYMVPTLYKILPALPRLPNSKLDRLSLPDPELSSGMAEFVEPRTKVEKILVEIWRETLLQGGENPLQIGLGDNFFNLGGHSLLATQLFSRIRQTLNLELPVSTLFDKPQLGEFSREVEQVLQERKRHPQAVDRGIEAVQRIESIPLSYAQERLWFVHEHMPDQRTSYNLVFAFHMYGEQLSMDALRAAVGALVDRHEALRTTFVADDQGNPLQLIADHLEIDVPFLEVAESEVDAIVAQQAAKVFDLQNGPLINVQVLKVTAEHHALLINIHHIVCDGWSLNIIVRDLHELYAAALNTDSATLPPLPLQYADYACWQRQQDLGSQLTYWKDQLKNYDEELALPYDFPRPADRAWQAASFHFEYPRALAARVAELSKNKQATLFMTLLASFAVVINQYADKDDICLGTTTAGRDQLELENLIGFFVNILALRLDLSGNPTATDLLQHTREQVLGAYENAALPFEHVLSALMKERDSSQIPLVPVMLRHQNFPTAEIDSLRGDVAMKPASVGSRTTPSEIDLQFEGDGSELKVTVEYARELFREVTIRRLLEQHQLVLEAMVEQPDCGLLDYPTLTAGAQSLLDEINRTRAAYDFSVTVCERFEKQVLLTPEATACMSVDGTDDTGDFYGEYAISYEQLNARANQLAEHLRAMGAGPKYRIALLCERSFEFIVGMLAVCKTGACYIPVDPGYPADFLSRMLKDAEPQLILGQSRRTVVVDGYSADLLIDLDADMQWVDSELGNRSPENHSAYVAPEQLACIMYTSGSTGNPKGVMVPYAQLINWMEASWKRMPFADGEIMLQKTSSAFAVSVKEMLSGLLAGAAQVIVPDSVVKDANALIAAIERWKVSRVHLIPSHLRTLLSITEDTQMTAWRSVKYIISAGEPLDRNTRTRINTLMPWVELWNNYGCTELNDTTYCAPGQQSDEQDFTSIGYPIANTQIYVLDTYLRRVPLGAVGELCVHSVGMARGYWRQAGMTAERFIANPYAEEAGSRLYKTGDVVRLLGDGSLEYVGRNDFEVKVRGYRVDVRQVEHMLNKHPAIKQSVVIGWPADTNQAHLAAYIELQQEHVISADELRDYLLGKLPTYMLPTLYTFLDQLPRLPNGKLNRPGLPDPEPSARHADYMAARTETEQRLADIFGHVLKVERVGLNDNFFSLGGHSLLSVGLIRDINTDFNVNISSTAFFNEPTVAGMARLIEKGDTGEVSSGVIVPLAENTEKPNLFCIHPIGGQVHYYAELATALSENYSVIGVVPDETVEYSSIHELAASYCDHIQQFQPQGSYRVLGWSSGGLLAHAIVAEMERHQMQVGYLGLIDSKLIPERVHQNGRLTLIAVLNIFATLRKRGFSDEDVDAISTLLRTHGWTESVFDSEHQGEALRVTADYFDLDINNDAWEYVVSTIKMTRYLVSLLAGYVPESLNTPVNLYKAIQSEALPGHDGRDVWADRVSDVNGNHYTIIQGQNAENIAHDISQNASGSD